MIARAVVPYRLRATPRGWEILLDCGADAPTTEAQLRALGLCGEATWLELPPTGAGPAPRGLRRTWHDAP